MVAMGTAADPDTYEIEAQPARPKLLRSKLMRVGVAYDAPPHSRTIPAEVESTDPDFPIERVEPKEHPYSPSATDDSSWARAEPENDPNSPK